MKIFGKALLGVGLLLGTGVCAMADIVWTFNDVVFQQTFWPDTTYQNELTGSFTTDDAVTHVESFNLNVTGNLASGLFTPAQMVDSYLPNTIGIADASFSDYIDLYLNSPLTSAGGTIDIGSGFDCTGCGTLLVNSDHRPTVTGVAATPEPTTLPVLGAGAVLVFFVTRRKLVRAS
ncbi:MAG TPA: PEP-CTERM sorting domain-containing protein [Bryobacteraceae bacterium]|nr:PEP-CTERM sorting domain-containing protein [Bryobacteraceae bacterium]